MTDYIAPLLNFASSLKRALIDALRQETDALER